MEDSNTFSVNILYLKFHGTDPVKNFSHVLPDHGPGDLIVALCSGFYGMTSHIIECNHVGQDTHSLVKRAKPENETECVSSTSTLSHSHECDNAE